MGSSACGDAAWLDAELARVAARARHRGLELRTHGGGGGVAARMHERRQPGCSFVTFSFLFLGATWKDSDKRGACGPSSRVRSVFFCYPYMCLMGQGSPFADT